MPAASFRCRRQSHVTLVTEVMSPMGGSEKEPVRLTCSLEEIIDWCRDNQIPLVGKFWRDARGNLYSNEVGGGGGDTRILYRFDVRGDYNTLLFKLRWL